ncbi:hypothetical protein F7018_09410 [Tenacibaculum aiptasiae]|uniref:Ricin B lectin domain-containing protein n=1 Tax=Tenacibaculum aiptasiae TaxID=426481 RepID=A0A7J5ALD6_9FLAO|nr:hypothetical protein [Tenacibaculum aiptasiae]KAB1158384.1 hypothetical protein F7018_09410 [Tenacibaculum aiptasiae]
MKTTNLIIKAFNDTNYCWEAFPSTKNEEIAMNTYDPENQDQKWTIIDSKITINTKNQGAKVAESYPNNNRLETSNNHPNDVDQVFNFQHVKGQDSNVYFISCNTKNQGLLYVYGNSKNHQGIGLREYNHSDTELYWVIE